MFCVLSGVRLSERVFADLRSAALEVLAGEEAEVDSLIRSCEMIEVRRRTTWLLLLTLFKEGRGGADDTVALYTS